MKEQEVALVTGATQGIGLQIAKELAGRGYIVLIGSRNLEHGKNAEKAVGPNGHSILLDVTIRDSIVAAEKQIRKEFGRLDVVINNAAIANISKKPEQSIAEFNKTIVPSIVSLDEIRAVFETNVFGPLAVYQVMLPLLREALHGRIVNVSSAMGSLTLMSDPNNPYRDFFEPVYSTSKTALNAMTVAMAIELAATGIKVNAVSPGFTNTALTGHEGTETVEQGAAEAVRVAMLGPNSPTGGFTHAILGKLPW